MAVEAHYPSNFLHLNRGIQQGKNQHGNDYSKLSLPGGGAGEFLDHPHLIFNNTPPVNNSKNNNPRKRGRDRYATPPPAKNLRLSSPSMQHHQLIDLSQLHTPPPNAVVSTGLGLSFGQQQQNHPVVSMLQQDTATQIKHQTDEIDQFLLAQLDEMRRKLAEKRQRHYRAKSQEATAAALQAQLQNAMMSRGCAQTQNVALTCASGEGSAGDAESVYIDPERVEVRRGPSCKSCQKRVASVVLLPCRHLCLCIECDGVVSSCPVCSSFKSSSVEVSIR